MFNPLLSKPLPAPTQSISGIPVRQVIHILDAAVFPIPISPKLITLHPLSWQSVTMSAPYWMANSISSCVMAASCRKLRVPFLIFRSISSGIAGKSKSTPPSTILISKPCWRERKQMPAPPFRSYVSPGVSLLWVIG